MWYDNLQGKLELVHGEDSAVWTFKCFTGGIFMKTHTRGLQEELAKKFSVDISQKHLIAIEKMKKGYESMAQINLDMCEMGACDYLYALLVCEEQLIGDDQESEY